MDYPFRSVIVAALSLAASLQAAEWSFGLPPIHPAPSVSVTPLLYGKTWGYAVEIDDGPVDTLRYADFFAAYKWTDAPPGIPGGRERPIIGSAAIIAGSVGANPKALSWDQIKELIDRGWGIANHSYSHKGRTFGDPPEILTPEEMREELFWSQAIIGAKSGLGRAPTHMVYPNGYTAYGAHLEEFGMRSGSLVGGSGRGLTSPKTDLKKFGRMYLDEGYWAKWGKGNAMMGFPDSGEPPPDELIIDFTHGMNADPESVNSKRWKERMDTITSRYGKDGTNTFWNAPAEEIINYKFAAAKAEVKIVNNTLRVALPDDIPGSALTLKLENVPASAKIGAPEGGVVYRQDTTVWLTTPVIGKPGAPLPKPGIKLLHKVPVGKFELPAPARIAGVIVQHGGKPVEDTEVRADVTTLDGKTETIASRTLTGGKYANGAMLLSAVPNREAPLAKAVTVTTGPTLRTMEIWVVAE